MPRVYIRRHIITGANIQRHARKSKRSKSFRVQVGVAHEGLELDRAVSRRCGELARKLQTQRVPHREVQTAQDAVRIGRAVFGAMRWCRSGSARSGAPRRSRSPSCRRPAARRGTVSACRRRVPTPPLSGRGK